MAKKSFRLGDGEFERTFAPVDPDFTVRETTRPSIEDARDRTLTACVQVEPQVLESLFSREPNLSKWGKQWNLNEPWCLRWAHRQLIKRKLQALAKSTPKATPAKATPARPPGKARAGTHFRTVRKITNFRFTNISVVAGPSPLPVPLQFQSEGWKFEQDDRRSFEARVTAEFARELGSYCDKIEKDAELAGFQRTREKRTENDFFWLARHHLKDERFADIADKSRFSTAPLTPKQVRIAVHRLAGLIGLPLKTR